MMKQLSFFDVPEKKKKKYWKIYIDGASRNNPGVSGAGIVILCDDVPVFEQGFFLGVKTNNQAEYLALLLSVFFAQSYIKDGESIHIISDSQLLIKQMQGVYKVKDATLLQIKQAAQQFIQKYHVTFEHVLRAYNTKADELANYGIDKKITPPKQFSNFIAQHIPVLSV
ncbi:reverse transcriptase-like protein [bacterium]|jgi:ribonuclease HI|nr:reverse transcriptase-like protein [bacterium]NBX78472.1 reverse transcriptase-like protein [bacterium]